MNHTSPFEVARVAHERLRRRVVGSRPDERSAADYSIIKTALDGLWRIALHFPEAAEIRHLIGGLRVDAEYLAGLRDEGGFRTADQVSQQYSLLERAFTPKADT